MTKKKKHLDQLTQRVILAIMKSKLSVRQISERTKVSKATIYSLLSDNRESGMTTTTIQKLIDGIGQPRLGFESNRSVRKRDGKNVRVSVLRSVVRS